jgi:uncharacterized protein (DUF885 family)
MIKKILKWLGAVLALMLFLGAGFGVHVWYFKPYDINLFFGREALKFALESPQLLSSIHVFEQFGINGHNAELDDDSMASTDRIFERLKGAHQVLVSYQDEDLSEADQMSKEIMLSLMNIMIDGEQFRFHNYPVNQMFGAQNGFPTFMESTHQVHSVGDAEDYVTRLSLVGIKFDQVIEGLEHREKLAILPPQFLVDKVLDEMRNFIETPTEEGILFAALVEKMEEAKLDEDEQKRIGQDARREIENTVYPAYGRLIAYFEALDPKVEGNYGVWNMPNGDEFYRLALKFWTTTDYSPDYIHDFGLREIDRIQAEILAILVAEDWDTSNGFEAAIVALSASPEFKYSDTVEGREQILDDYRAMIEEISAGLEPFFDVMPAAPIEVDRVPEFTQKTAPAAYYQPPAMDGSRPGVFYANLYDIDVTRKFRMRTLAYHEGVPGHHFQLAIQQEQEDLPFFRRMVPFSAYAEGWALYSERLAWELGFQDDPYDNIGRLQDELLRAVRLVVDTGIHAKRWSRESAIEYMSTNTGMPQTDVVSEIERYFVLPGQACAYKIGMTKILEFRDLAEAELGDAYDIREFHNVILTNGSMPLTTLEKLVRQYIAAKKAG